MMPGLWQKVQVAEQERNRDQRTPALLCSAWAAITATGSPALPWQAATGAHMQRHHAHMHTQHTDMQPDVSGGKTRILSTGAVKIFNCENGENTQDRKTQPPPLKTSLLACVHHKNTKVQHFMNSSCKVC